ncbi:hypothetical protein [Corynebacterium sp. 335C]
MTDADTRAGWRPVAVVVLLAALAALIPHAVAAATGGGDAVHETTSTVALGGDNSSWTASYPARPEGAQCDRVSSATIGAREFRCKDTGVTVTTMGKSGVADPAGQGGEGQPADAEAVAVILSGPEKGIAAEADHLLSTVKADPKEEGR